MRRRLLVLSLLLPGAAMGQNSRYDGITLGPSGPVGNQTVAICSQPANVSTRPCAPLARIFSTPGGAAETNPLTSDALGSFHFYVSPGTYTIQIYGPQLSPTSVQTDISIGLYNLNTFIYVDGSEYPTTPAGIQAALNQASSRGGGTVIVGPTGSSSTIAMGRTGLKIPSNVCLIGGGPRQQTVLRWTSNLNAITLTNGTKYACLENLTLSFSSTASSSSVAIRVTGSDAAATQYNTFKDLYITFDTIGTRTAGIFASSRGPSNTDVTLNTFDNILVSRANQFAVCEGCEGNFWNNVQGVDLGGTNGATLFQEISAGSIPTNDEMVTARMEAGSGNASNLVCYSTTGNNNVVRLTCDTNLTSTAINDMGGYNIFDVDLVGVPTIGTIHSTSQYRYVSSSSGMAAASSPIIVAQTSQKPESGADADVLTFTPPANAGSYRIRFVLSLSAAHAATLGWTATWKDSNGNAQSPTNLSLFHAGTAVPGLTFTTSAAGSYYGDAQIDIDNSATDIVIKLTFTGTWLTGKASATLERII